MRNHRNSNLILSLVIHIEVILELSIQMQNGYPMVGGHKKKIFAYNYFMTPNNHLDICMRSFYQAIEYNYQL